jgi:hypothetical protein
LQELRAIPTDALEKPQAHPENASETYGVGGKAGELRVGLIEQEHRRGPDQHRDECAPIQHLTTERPV